MNITCPKELLQHKSVVDESISRLAELDMWSLQLRISVAERDPLRVGLAVLRICDLGGQPFSELFPTGKAKGQVPAPQEGGGEC